MKNKAWYRDPTVIISSIALIVSGYSACFSYFNENYQRRQTKEELLRSTLIEITEVRRRSNLDGISEAPEDTKIVLAKFSSQSRDLYLRKAEGLVQQIPDQVTAPQYIMIAGELESDYDLTRAEEYFLAAIDVSSTPLQTAQSIISASNFYLRIGEQEKANALFTSIDPVLATVGSDHILLQMVQLYGNTALEAASSGYSNFASKASAITASTHSKISDPEISSQISIERLQTRLEQLGVNIGASEQGAAVNP